ncbi:MAG TPA: hypothetical protein DDW95_00235 [Alphaproteobacteria bacterium]|jgi:uncharacterized protein (UPF0262 family)|nr:hypothetical protein [Alphaproteobacteria bacterium]HAM46925.1 hypothetical protein [Alphaproteobacteria bacterium]HBA42862.1 hypothetical protein [Alphaproteobacteria bacterium]HBC53378.1 hypothetical protein [Alphaproteobacteria bacterium]HBF96950.1 hypothetical protein [Alphaproteobacteria bacterium]
MADNPTTGTTIGPDHRVANILLDENNIVRLNPDIEHERGVAIFDLLEDNYFEPVGSPGGPYILHLSIADNRLVFDIHKADDSPLGKIMLALSPFRKIVKDYFAICDSYFEAIKTAPPSQIEAIDMGRRGLHNDGSALLRERLAGKIEIDDNTARRLFTLICVLHIRA